MKRFLLVYGSQTGQSQVISEQIAEKATSKGFKVDLNCLDQSGAKVSYPVKLMVDVILLLQQARLNFTNFRIALIHW